MQNNNQWFQIKEQGAGNKRLALTWFLYKIFGEKALRLVAFLMSVFILIFSPTIRNSSKTYFQIIYPQTNLKPSLLNQFKHILSYANSLVDKMLIFSGNFNIENIEFDDKKKEKQMFEDINEKQGVFFLCNHIGNIEALQAFFFNSKTNPDFGVNIFLSRKQSKIFNEFLQSIKKEFAAEIHNVEDIGIETGVELKESLDNGEIVFIAGDRLSENDTEERKHNIAAKMFSNTIYLPKGSFKLAKLMNVPTYFISAVKQDNKYKVYIKKAEDLTEENLVKSFVDFEEEMALINPYQFFNFYDFFVTEQD